MEKKNKTKIKKSKKLKTVVVIVLILLAVLGIGYLRSKKQMEDKRAAMEEQRQVMIDSWKDQGLSEEEIQEKLKTQRSEGFNPGEDMSLFHSIFRVVSGRSGNRPGMGDGTGPGRMMK